MLVYALVCRVRVARQVGKRMPGLLADSQLSFLQSLIPNATTAVSFQACPRFASYTHTRFAFFEIIT
jgi:hypothetical protein